MGYFGFLLGEWHDHSTQFIHLAKKVFFHPLRIIHHLYSILTSQPSICTLFIKHMYLYHWLSWVFPSTEYKLLEGNLVSNLDYICPRQSIVWNHKAFNKIDNIDKFLSFSNFTNYASIVIPLEHFSNHNHSKLCLFSFKATCLQRLFLIVLPDINCPF